MINDSLFLEVFNASEDAILIIDGGSFVDCNQATLRMLHCNSKGKLLPAPPWELSPPFQPDGRPSEEKAEEMIRIARERNFHRFEWVHVRADGEEFPAEVTLTPIHLNGKNMLYVVWRDLTEQKRIEQNLRQSEERFRNVARVTTDVIWDWDLQSDTRWWSDGIQRHFGYSPEELEQDSRSWTARIHAEDRPRVLVGIQAIINGKVTEWNDEYRFVCKDDSVAEVADNGIIIRDQSGQPVRMVGGMTNVTEQRHYEQQLRQAVHVLASTREGVTITDAQKCILSINQAFTDITGYTEKEVRGKTPGILSSGLHDDKFYKAILNKSANRCCTGHAPRPPPGAPPVVATSA